MREIGKRKDNSRPPLFSAIQNHPSREVDGMHSLGKTCMDRNVVDFLTSFMVGIQDIRGIALVNKTLSLAFMDSNVVKRLVESNFCRYVKVAGLCPEKFQSALHETRSIVAGSFLLGCITGNTIFHTTSLALTAVISIFF